MLTLHFRQACKPYSIFLLTMRLVTVFNKKICLGIFVVVFCSSIGFMLGSLQSLGVIEDKAKLTDKLNQAEMELFEAERQLVHCDSELGLLDFVGV